MAMSPQTAQTKYPHQVLLHDTEIIILARDTVLDLHLAISTGTDTGLTGPGHIPTITGTEVTARAIHREVTPGHITDAHTGAHPTTDTQTHIIIDGTPDRRSSLHRSSSTHSRDCSRSRPHNLHRTTHMATSKPTYSSSRTAWKNKDKKYKQVTIDDPPSNYYSSDEPSSESDEDLN